MPLCIDINNSGSPHAAVYSLRKIAPETIPHSRDIPGKSVIQSVKILISDIRYMRRRQ